ncbi:DUF3613 domain-containing protein [Thioalkalivibrio sp. ALJ24]|uniref:DUF3613 domain-containing protein n=1 Tax=Thioalkalivibrio sp. ALJ24 TaxID=545276 RepID=UPI00037F7CBC|nr:DUF3613 domain-containing protein [Thioalkalivibrio sp. ALJ24]
MKALSVFSVVSGGLFLVMGMMAGPVTAGTEVGSRAVADAGVDSSPSAGARDWLSMQRGGEQASGHVQGLSEAARTRALRRYLDSFSHPIPPHYIDRDSFSAD